MPWPAPAPTGPAPPSRAPWLLPIPLTLAALAYARVLHGELVFDDVRLEQDPALRAPGVVLRGFLATLRGGGRPVTDLTFALNRAAGGLDPFGYHLVGLALHLVATALLFLLARAILRLAGAERAPGTALVVAGLFALHPLQSEAVSYVTQRSEVLASGLYVAALLLLLAAERRGWTAAGIASWLGALATFGLALGAKAIAVTLPAAYLLLTGLVPGAEGRKVLASWPWRLLMVGPLAALDLAFSLRTLGALSGRQDAGFGVPGLERGSYLLSQCEAIVTYLRLLLWPAGQSVDWQLPLSPGLADPEALAAALLLLAIGAAAALAWRWARRREDAGGAAGRAAAFGVAWFFLVLSPTSSLVPLADLLAEHRVYLASFGIFLAAAVLGERLLARLPGRRRTLAALALVGAAWIALAAALHRRNAVWETRLALWSAEVARQPGAWRAHFQLGYAHLRRGEPQAAAAEYRLALAALGDRHPDLQARVLDGLGVALLAAGRTAEALGPLREARQRLPGDPQTLAKLAVASWKAGDREGAERLALQVLEGRPGNVDALQVLGAARLERGDLPGARQAFARAVEADPEDGQQLFNLGVVSARLGRMPEACQAWGQVGRSRAAPAIREQAARARAAACR